MGVDVVPSYTGNYLRITKELSNLGQSNRTHIAHEEEETQEECQDTEALVPVSRGLPLIHYDIFLSPTYRVPALYFHVCDSLHRFPPTMDTLYSHILSPQYIDQTKDVGVLGGITITDHPILARPVFFIHPCRTAEVMEAGAGGREISPFEYLVMWLGAMGKSVNLDVPMELALQEMT